MSKYSTSKSYSLLSDSSWIKKAEDENEIIDPEPDAFTTTTSTRSASVQALAKRFSASEDDLGSSDSPTSRLSYTRSYTTQTCRDEPRSSTTTTVTNNGTSETTITTTTQTLRSSVIGSPTQTFNERVKSSSKGAEDKLYQTLIPSSIKGDFSPSDSQKTVSSTETVRVSSISDSSAEDKLYDTLLPSTIRTDYSPTDSKTSVFTSKTVTVKSNPDEDDLKTTTITRTPSTPEDQLYDTLLPRSITSPNGEQTSSFSTRRTSSYSSYTDDSPTTRTTSYTISSSRPSDDFTSDQKRYSYTKSSSSYNDISSPTSSIITTRTSRSDDMLSDPFYTRSSSVRSDRIVHEKDLCTQCRKPFDATAKMVLPEMKINCHATCFKCEVCNSTLGHMKAGDSLWIYRSMVHCDNCFDITREKWRH
ncbi:sciellin isoform X2 [Takifugu rubripes]|uniref:sciellin isoform X2 n=1 Tax=Takifugu rubripes TaxID=31033 RepID=UPI00114582CA|nr:sciellin isoform X2 [Takifugu rubripes]